MFGAVFVKLLANSFVMRGNKKVLTTLFLYIKDKAKRSNPLTRYKNFKALNLFYCLNKLFHRYKKTNKSQMKIHICQVNVSTIQESTT